MKNCAWRIKKVERIQKNARFCWWRFKRSLINLAKMKNYFTAHQEFLLIFFIVRHTSYKLLSFRFIHRERIFLRSLMSHFAQRFYFGILWIRTLTTTPTCDEWTQKQESFCSLMIINRNHKLYKWLFFIIRNIYLAHSIVLLAAAKLRCWMYQEKSNFVSYKTAPDSQQTNEDIFFYFSLTAHRCLRALLMTTTRDEIVL